MKAILTETELSRNTQYAAKLVTDKYVENLQTDHCKINEHPIQPYISEMNV